MNLLGFLTGKLIATSTIIINNNAAIIKML